MAENNVPQSVWEEKDKRIVRQSSLKVAADIVLRTDTSDDIVSKVKDVAQELTDWVYEKANEQDDKPIVLPTPTAAQAKVLTKIAAELKQDVETIKPKVLDFAEKQYNIRKYPENLQSVPAFVDGIKS